MKCSTLVFLGTVFLMMSCTGETEPPEPPAEEPSKSEASEAKDSDMIGLTQKAAEAMATERGLKHRVMSVDGDNRPVTMDYRVDRVNFTIEAGKVVKVTRG